MFLLDADISQCFDRINHKALLNKLNTFPTIRRQIRAWLKAGVMDNMQFQETSEGTPQGGVISPLLANIALHGMEERIKDLAETFDLKRSDGKYQLPKRDKRDSVQLIRYADDFVILHKDITVVQRCQQVIAEWLEGMGLELKPSKTRLTHTLNRYEDNEPGFNFLGFNIRQSPAGKYTSGKDPKKRLLGFTTIITPNSQKLKIHYEKIVSTINAYKSAPQAALIRNLNPMIRGWANYYSTVVSKKAYGQLDYLMYKKLRVWAKHRHRNKTTKWIAKKYWQSIGGDNWVFATRQEGKNPMRLLKHSRIPIVRHVKVKGEASPYDAIL
ncbi:MAG: reverse transcriptase domain-containing protein [Nostoc sp.]|uniref:reverse transcriptase domain-containing protein n=1 Tax=Nostoc sp. TaxID=1180 RepID=UPI002FFA536A